MLFYKSQLETSVYKKKFGSTPLLYRQNTPVSTRQPAEKCLGLHGYPFDIFKIVHRHSRGFLCAFRARERLQGMSLWYFAKQMGYLLFKDKLKEKTCRIYASFPKFSKPIPNPCQLLDESI